MYKILIRCGGARGSFILVDHDGEEREFPTFGAARAAAERSACVQAMSWPYDVVRADVSVDRPVGGCECGDMSLFGAHFDGCQHKNSVDPDAVRSAKRELHAAKLEALVNDIRQRPMHPGMAPHVTRAELKTLLDAIAPQEDE